MHRLIRPLAVLIAAVAFAGAAQAQSLMVGINQAERIGLPGTARDVVVGNPEIADVAVIDGRTLVVTGKSYGVTNLLVLDGRGRTILDRRVAVSATEDGQVSFYRGAALQSYACTPRCSPTGAAPGGSAPAPGVGGQVPDTSSGE
ncbi:MAG: pilus assembly protein N-terminal domain-containing protein [Pseudomonadota bacterium]